MIGFTGFRATKCGVKVSDCTQNSRHQHNVWSPIFENVESETISSLKIGRKHEVKENKMF